VTACTMIMQKMVQGAEKEKSPEEKPSVADHIDEVHNMMNESAGAAQVEMSRNGETSREWEKPGEAVLQTPESSSGEETQPAVDTLSIEQSFAELEKILAAMQNPQIPLEESFRAYERGMKLVKHCNDRIRDVEQKVQKLGADGGFTDFDVQ